MPSNTPAPSDPNAEQAKFLSGYGSPAPAAGAAASTGAGSPGGSALPGDTGNPLAPSNQTPAPPQSGTIIDSDPNNSGLPTATIDVNGKLITLTLNSSMRGAMPIGEVGGPGKLQTVLTALNSITSWYQNTSTRQKYINEMYAAGLISSKKAPSATEVARAWQLVVQESALQIQDPSGDIHMFSPDDVLSKAAKQGWSNIGAKQAPGDAEVSGTGNLNNTTDTSSQSETVYKSYVDPATAMGTLADSYFRLMGRNPTSGEYNAFLHSIYTYQEQENTGKFEDTTKGPTTGPVTDPVTGQPVDQSGTTGGAPTGGTSTQTNVVSQRGIGPRGIQFMAGQQALASPEEGAYQAATTYFNAFIKALSGPASGMQASGPTNATP
jgi:hypothetical protein